MPVLTKDQTREVIEDEDTRPFGWPVMFYVCTFHKINWFADYEEAIQDDSKCCILCAPCVENDSLGG